MDKREIQSYHGHPVPIGERQAEREMCGCLSSIFGRRKEAAPKSNGIHGKPDQWQQPGFNIKNGHCSPRDAWPPQKPQGQDPTDLGIAYHTEESNQWYQQRGANEALNHRISNPPATEPMAARQPAKLDTIQTVAAADEGISPVSPIDRRKADAGPVHGSKEILGDC